MERKTGYAQPLVHFFILFAIYHSFLFMVKIKMDY